MSTAMRLYEYVDDYETVLDWIEEHEDVIREAGGELPPELEALLDEVEGAVEEKVKRVALVVQNMLAAAKAAKAEADRLSALAASRTRQADSLKTYLAMQIRRLGTTRVDTDLVKVRIQRNGRPSIRPLDPEHIPEPFRRVRVEFDGAVAYDTLKSAGLLQDAPDTFDIEGLRVEYGEHVRIW